MPRRTLRFLAIAVLLLLGAPVATHVVMHDLHGHHDEDGGTYASPGGDGDHEHPVVASGAPAVPALVKLALPMTAEPDAEILRTVMQRRERDALTHGALRIDDDVGLHALLSTFLI